MNGQKMMLIINPAAGKGEAKTALNPILSKLCAGGRGVSVFMTESAGDAAQLAEMHGADFDTLVCVGGDGTLSEVMGGVVRIEEEKRPLLGYIPMGTANDMAATLGLPHVPEAAAQRVLDGTPRSLDVGFLGDDSFGYVAAFGAFTEVSYETPQSMKKTFGHLAYVIGGAASIPNIKPCFARVEYDGGVIEGSFIYGSVTNSMSVAGMVKLSPEAVDLGDGMFELLLIRAPKNPAQLQHEVHCVLTQNYDGEDAVFLHTGRARFTFSESVPWTRDGEAGGDRLTAEVRNLCRAVKIIV